MAFQPPAPQPMEIAGPSGILQAIVDDPGSAQAGAIAVICHPHPLQGGTMNNKVVHTLARALNECAVPTVRFNYRGVGDSVGTYDGGAGETDDALAVIEWARLRWPDRPLWLAGFSFGGGVAVRAALRTQAVRLITVAPAMARDAPPVQLNDCAWLVIQGDADEVVSPQIVIDWANALTPRPDLKVLVGAGHFFHGRLIELREVVRDWIRG